MRDSRVGEEEVVQPKGYNLCYLEIFYTLCGVRCVEFVIFAPKRVYSYDSISEIC